MCKPGILEAKYFLDQKKEKLSISQSVNNTLIKREDGHLEDRKMNAWGEKLVAPWPRVSAYLDAVARHIRH